MKLINFCLLILVVALTSVKAEGEGEQPPPVEQPPAEQPPVEQPPAEQPPAEQPPAEQPPPDQPPADQPPAEQPPQEQPPPITELVATTPASPATESWEIETLEYTDFRMSIDHSLGNVLVQIVDWQASMFDHIQSNLTPLLTKWDELKSAIKATESTEAAAIRSADANHSKSLLQQQVSLLKEALSTGNRIENNLVHEQKEIDQWLVEVNTNVEGARNRKANVSAALDSMVNAARNHIKETKSSIQKIFQNHYFAIDNDRLSANGKFDKMALDFKATLSQLITSVQVTNNSVSNRLAQDANTLQEVIDSTVSTLRHQLDSNLLAADRDKIVNHLDERAQQLDENLFIGHSENQIALDNTVRNLIADINNNMWSLDNDHNTMKNQFEQLTSVNKLRANRLSIQTYKTLEPVESLLSSLSKRLQRTVDSVRL